MKPSNLIPILFSLVVLVLAGCGGGGGGGGVGTTGNPTVSGVASKGPIQNGHYEVYQIYSSHNPSKSNYLNHVPLFSGSTDLQGGFSFPIPASLKKDGLVIKLIDGDYKDEATNSIKHIALEYPGGMHVTFGNMSGVVKRGEHLKVCITPYTEMAFRNAGASLDDNAVKAGQAEIEHAFGFDNKGIDIVHTQPLDPNSAPPAGADDKQKGYTNSLAVMSQYESDNSATGKLQTNYADDLITEIHNNNGLLTQATKTRLAASELTYDNSGKNKMGVSKAGVTITMSATKLTASISTASSTDPVAISAAVKVDGIAVPNTMVTFAVKSGAGSINPISAPTDASGIATTSLTSALDGDSDVVSASAGGFTADSPSINFSDPNKPLSVTLSASPGSGTTLANGWVTLTAIVTPVSASGSIPIGTVVSFFTTGGTLSAITSTGPGGIATARLASTIATTFSVTAQAGTATSAALPVKFVNQPTKAVLKLSTTGIPAGTLVGAIDVTAFLPAGVTVAKNPDGSPALGVAIGSGSAAGLGVTGNANTSGQVRCALATTAGFAGGEFLTINADIAAGTFPTPADFLLPALNGSILDPTVHAIPGAGVSLSVAIQ